MSWKKCEICDEKWTKVPYTACYGCNQEKRDKLKGYTKKCKRCPRKIQSKYILCYSCTKNKKSSEFDDSDNSDDYDCPCGLNLGPACSKYRCALYVSDSD
jgi:hypothetical protein